MALHVIVGAGRVGSGTATLLADAGHQVRVVTRSGGGPRRDGIELVAADASDAAVLRGLTAGAASLYNCANPPYHRWPTDWPPLAAALLDAARHGGASLVIMGNLYGYGEVDRPMTEAMPLAARSVKGRVRNRMWADALASGIRVTEARASDFFGPTVGTNTMIGEMFVPRLLAGKAAFVLGRPDVPHSWSYLPDVTRALALLGTSDPDGPAWGRAWHVPVAPPESLRGMARRVVAAGAAGSDAACDTGGPVDGTGQVAGQSVGQAAGRAWGGEPTVRRIPEPVIRAAGLAVPMMREFAEVRYQHDRPFVMDSTDFTATFGMAATPMDEAVSATVTWWRGRTGASPRARTA